MVTMVIHPTVNGKKKLDPISTQSYVSELEPSKLILNLTTSPKPVADPSELVFGQIFTDHMLVTSFHPATGWSAPIIQPFQSLTIDPSSSCLQYCSNLFEGMKAYVGQDGTPRLFRPDLNMKRMKSSAERLALPPFDADALLALIKKLVLIDRRFIPALPGYSLYIRPTMIGTRASLGVTASTEAMIYVICSPTGSYFGAGAKRISLYAVHDSVRAWPGGTGEHKLGLNYAPTFGPQRAAAARGYKQVLWLFGEDFRITEAGAMNFFAVLARPDGDGLDLVTPPLDGTILPGVTRTSILALVRAHGEETPLPGLPPTLRLHLQERKLTIGELQERSARGEFLEAFGAGTAVIVASVDRIGYHEEDIVLPALTPVADALHERIEAIQEGRFEWEGWSVKCE